MIHLNWLAREIPLAFTALLPVINPIATSLILLSMTDNADKKCRRLVAKKVARNTVLLLTALLVGGSYLLDFFGISIPIVQTAGGLVLGAMGWKLLNQDPAMEKRVTGEQVPMDEHAVMERTFYPFTFPITVGPGSVAVILTLSAHSRHSNVVETMTGLGGVVIGIIGIGVLTYFSILYSKLLADRLGHSGTKVTMRLIAFIVVCIGAQICWTGVRSLAEQINTKNPAGVSSRIETKTNLPGRS